MHAGAAFTGELRELEQPAAIIHERLTNIQSLPDSFGNLSSLQGLDLGCCAHIDTVPDSFGNLSSLEELTLQACTRLQNVPDSFGGLSNQQLPGSFCSRVLNRLLLLRVPHADEDFNRRAPL